MVLSLRTGVGDVRVLLPSVSPTLDKFSMALRWFQLLQVLLGEVHVQVICKYLMPSWALLFFSCSVLRSCPFVTDINIISCYITHEVCVKKHLAV